MDKGEVRTIKKKPLTKDQRIEAHKKKKADELARRARIKQQKLAKIAAGRKALKAKQDAARAKKKK